MEFKVGNIKEGDHIRGKVYKVAKNEVTVDINYVTEGTIYANELTKKPIDSCAEIVNEGDEIDVIVKKIDDDQGVVLLSRLDIEAAEAFEFFQEMFNEERAFEAKVIKTNKGGLMLNSQGFDRLFMPISEIDTEYVTDLEHYVGKTMKVKAIEINRRKVVVSHKSVLKDVLKDKKREELDNINIGDVLEGEVVKTLAYGAFIRFGQVEGLLHISEISHHKVDKVEDHLKEGDKVEVKIIGADGDKRSLSMKALQKTPWEVFIETHEVGDEVTGKIVRKMQFGMLIEVSPDVVGMINRYDYSWNPRINLAGEVNVGDEVNVKILSIDEKDKKMTLSKKHLEYNPWEDVKVKIGESVSGQVKELQSNGALVEVQGVNAFLPIGEIVERRINDVSEVLKKDDVINAIVLKFDKRRWQMVISKKAHDIKEEREEFKKHLRSENKEDQSQTLGELFADKLKKFK